MKVGSVANVASIPGVQQPNLPHEGSNVSNTLGNNQEEQENFIPINEKAVIEAIEKANKVMIDHRTRAEFSVHEATKDIMVKIIDVETNKVVREIPPKKILDLVAKLWDLAGIIVDERR